MIAKLSAAAAFVAFVCLCLTACASQPKNNFIGTWALQSGGHFSNKKLIIGPETLDEEDADGAHPVTVEYKVVNDREALMDAALGAKIKLEIDNAGLLHYRDLDQESIYQRG